MFQTTNQTGYETFHYRMTVTSDDSYIPPSHPRSTLVMAAKPLGTSLNFKPMDGERYPATSRWVMWVV